MNNLINTTGYTVGAKTYHNPFNIIPTGRISMKNTDVPLLAIPSKGKPVIMEPGFEYNFPKADFVIEQKLNNVKQLGGLTGAGQAVASFFGNPKIIEAIKRGEAVIPNPVNKKASKYNPKDDEIGLVGKDFNNSSMSVGQVKAMQKMLKSKGFNPGKVDGLWGRRSQNAWDAWKKAGVDIPGLFNNPEPSQNNPEPSQNNPEPSQAQNSQFIPATMSNFRPPSTTSEEDALQQYNIDRVLGSIGAGALDGLSAGYAAGTKVPWVGPLVGAATGVGSALERGIFGTDNIGTGAQIAGGLRLGQQAFKALPKGSNYADFIQGSRQGLVKLANTGKEFINKGNYLIDNKGGIFTLTGKKIKDATTASKNMAKNFFKKGESISKQEYNKMLDPNAENLAYGLTRNSAGQIQKMKDTRGGFQKIWDTMPTKYKNIMNSTKQKAKSLYNKLTPGEKEVYNKYESFFSNSGNSVNPNEASRIFGSQNAPRNYQMGGRMYNIDTFLKMMRKGGMMYNYGGSHPMYAHGGLNMIMGYGGMMNKKR